MTKIDIERCCPSGDIKQLEHKTKPQSIDFGKPCVQHTRVQIEHEDEVADLEDNQSIHRDAGTHKNAESHIEFNEVGTASQPVPCEDNLTESELVLNMTSSPYIPSEPLSDTGDNLQVFDTLPSDRVVKLFKLIEEDISDRKEMIDLKSIHLTNIQLRSGHLPTHGERFQVSKALQQSTGTDFSSQNQHTQHTFIPESCGSDSPNYEFEDDDNIFSPEKDKSSRHQNSRSSWKSWVLSVLKDVPANLLFRIGLCCLIFKCIQCTKKCLDIDVCSVECCANENADAFDENEGSTTPVASHPEEIQVPFVPEPLPSSVQQNCLLWTVFLLFCYFIWCFWHYSTANEPDEYRTPVGNETAHDVWSQDNMYSSYNSFSLLHTRASGHLSSVSEVTLQGSEDSAYWTHPGVPVQVILYNPSRLCLGFYVSPTQQLRQVITRVREEVLPHFPTETSFFIEMFRGETECFALMLKEFRLGQFNGRNIESLTREELRAPIGGLRTCFLVTVDSQELINHQLVVFYRQPDWNLRNRHHFPEVD